MILKAAGKINLMLDILGTTDDGYHSLFMIMQSIGIRDTVEIVETGNPNEIKITCTNKNIPCDKTNICYKAAERYFNHTGIHNPGVQINIDKKIPFAAGLAGGSADGAAVFYGLNKMMGEPLNITELSRLSEKTGADIPFCIQGGTMLAVDVGGVLAPLPSVREDYYVLVKPDQDVSTKEAYALADSYPFLRHLDKQGMLRALVLQDMGRAYDRIGNVFEQFVEVPDRVEIKTIMRKCGAIRSCMSGSGPTVYGIFENSENSEKCVRELKKAGFSNVHLCRPVSSGLEIVEEKKNE